MNERNLKDLINCDSTDKEKMIESAKEKLRWYTFEASEEEFDVEAVDALVKFLRDVEPELGVILEDEKDKTVHVQKRRVIEWNRGKIAAAVVIGVLTLTLASIIVGNSLGTSLAWEDGGFFRWLQRDKEGQTMITSPEELGFDIGREKWYERIEDVPVEYQQYLVSPEVVEELDGYTVENIKIVETNIVKKVSEVLVTKSNKRLILGVMVYGEEVVVVRERYDDLEYQYTKSGRFEQDIFVKKTEEEGLEYSLFFYQNNKKYYVSGQTDLSELESIAEQFFDKIL